MAFPDSWSSERLAFERLTLAHRAEIRRFQTDPEVMHYIGGVRTEEGTDAYFAKNLSAWDRHQRGTWVVREHGRPEMVGVGVLRDLVVEGVPEVETGYGFFPRYWGKGYATEIARACLARGFGTLGLESIVAVTHPDNAASHHVLRKAGMTLEREFLQDGDRASLFRIHRGEWR